MIDGVGICTSSSSYLHTDSPIPLAHRLTHPSLPPSPQTAVRAWPKWIPPSIITVAQISQMIVGVGICASSFYFLHMDSPSPPSLPPSLPPSPQTAVKAWPKWIPPSIITVAQISQMIVGVGICASSFYFLYTDPEHCQVKRQNVYAGALMYGSYLYLFCDFFVRRFLRGGKPRLGEEKSAVLTMTKKIKAM